MLIVLGTAHREGEVGKCSPDMRFREAIYSREIVPKIAEKLRQKGYKVEIDYMPMELPKKLQNADARVERNNELKMRVATVNDYCDMYGNKNVVYISVHNNACPPDDGKWHKAEGWQVCVGSKASKASKRLAECLFDAALSRGMRVRKPSAHLKYWSQNLYVMNYTRCPACLTENLFQDNMGDVEYLLSQEGRSNIIDIHVDGIIKYITE